MSTRISTFFLNRNLRPRRLEQFYSVLQSSIDETNSEVVDTSRAERTYVEMNDNNSILNFVNKMKKADSSILCSNVIKLAKLNPEQEQVWIYIYDDSFIGFFLFEVPPTSFWLIAFLHKINLFPQSKTW